VSQLHDVEQADIPLAALDPAHVVAVQVGQFGQFLLRQPPFEPKLADALSEDDSRVGWHAAIIGSVTTMSLHTMSVIGFAEVFR